MNELPALELIAHCNQRRTVNQSTTLDFASSLSDENWVRETRQELSHLTDYDPAPLVFGTEDLLEEYPALTTTYVIVTKTDDRLSMKICGSSPHLFTAQTAKKIIANSDAPVTYAQWLNGLSSSPNVVLHSYRPVFLPDEEVKEPLGRITRVYCIRTEEGWVVRLNSIAITTSERVEKELTAESVVEEYKESGGKETLAKYLRDYTIRFLNSTLDRESTKIPAILYLGINDEKKATGLKMEESMLLWLHKKLDRELLRVFPPIPPKIVHLHCLRLENLVEPRFVIKLVVDLDKPLPPRPFFTEYIGAAVLHEKSKAGLKLLPPVAVWWRERPQAFQAFIEAHLLVSAVILVSSGTKTVDLSPLGVKELASFTFLDLLENPNSPEGDEEIGLLLERGRPICVAVVLTAYDGSSPWWNVLAMLWRMYPTLTFLALGDDEWAGDNVLQLMATSPVPLIGSTCINSHRLSMMAKPHCS